MNCLYPGKIVMEPIEVLLAAITALKGIKEIFFKSNNQAERRLLENKQRKLEQKIDSLESKVIKLDKRKGGQGVSLRLFYCQDCGKLVFVQKNIGPIFCSIPCARCGSWQKKVKTTRMCFKYCLQGMVALTECPQCRSINEISLRSRSTFNLNCKCHNCGCKFNFSTTNRWYVDLFLS